MNDMHLSSCERDVKDIIVYLSIPLRKKYETYPLPSSDRGSINNYLMRASLFLFPEELLGTDIDCLSDICY